MLKTMISIVVPVYNVENYLDRCVISLVNQTYSNLEIILVDDGSTDSSGNKCDQWANKDTRIKVIHKENAGLGMARNTGIENANGDFLFFIDSDDFVDTKLVEKCLEAQTADKSEVVVYGYSHYKDGNIIKEIPLKRKKYYGIEVQEEFLPRMICADGQTKYPGSAWSKMYSKEYIDKYKFRYCSEREFISEDYYSNLILFNRITSVSIIPDILYFYCHNTSSLSKTFRKDRLEKNNFQYEASVKLCEKYSYSDRVKDALTIQYYINLLGILHLVLETDLTKREQKNEIFRLLVNDNMLSILKKIDIHKLDLANRVFLILILKKMKSLVYIVLKKKYGGSQ